MSAYLADQMQRGTDDRLNFLANFVRASREAASLERLRREGKPHATRRPRRPT
jgi:hypothetical protein